MRRAIALLSLTAGVGLLVLGLSCGSSATIEELKTELSARERRIQVLETERAALEKKSSELEQALRAAKAAPVVQAPTPSAEDPCDARLAQLRATLNKAYLDIKIALVERDEFKNKLAAIQASRKDKPTP